MKALCLFVVCFLALPVPAHGEADSRVRPLDPWAAEALRLGIERSALLRELVARLQTSDVIVHVETQTALPFGASGMTRLAATTVSHRYVRIVLLRDPLPVRQVAVLGHELHHACEIANSQAKDRDGMRALFNAIGRRSTGHLATYETESAIQAGLTVWFEVHGDDKRAAQHREAARHE